MTPTHAPPAGPDLLTLEEFLARHSGDYVELIDGKVVPIPMPTFEHGRVCSRADRAFGGFIEAHDLGEACSNDTFVLVQRDPPRVRGADFAYWPKDRVPPGKPPGVLPEPPALCVEVVSPTNTWDEIFTKTAEYHAAGVTAVVVLDPDTKIAAVYRKLNGDDHDEFKVGEVLTVPDVLPGFAVPVAKLFGA